MPIYEYACNSCGERFEVVQRFSDPPLEHCRACNGVVRKVIAPTAFVLKGSGWYKTDYASSSRKQVVDAEKETTKPSPSTDGKAPASEGSKQ